MKNKIPFLLCLVLVASVVFTVGLKGEQFSFLEGKAIAVVQQVSSPTSGPPWSLLDKILEPDPVFDNIDLAVGNKDITYYEERFLRDESGNIKFDKNGVAQKEKIKKTDPEREIALKLLNLKTGATEVIKIKKIGADIVNPSGYNIEVMERLNGITWNAHNTYYNVIEPADTVVIRNVWPQVKYVKKTVIVTERGKKKKIIVSIPIFDANKPYVPYSDGLKSLEIVEKGKKDLKLLVQQSKDKLRQNQVMSRAFPGQLVADVLPDEYYWRRPIIEQSDLVEFILDPEGTTERFFVILATNGPKAWSSCNYADACGIFQFTSKTYSYVVKTYPSAKLIKDFKTGSLNHTNTTAAATLLDDMNLTDLIKRHGGKIYNDPRLEEYLAASYNGSPSWVWQSLNATLNKTVADWTKYLKSETKGFLVKLRYLKDNNIPQ